jgi:hypothetical protein
LGEEVIVHEEASEAKPTAVTEITLFFGLIGEESVSLGLTVKLAEPVSTTVPVLGQLTVIVYAPAPGPLGTDPTVKVPYTFPGGTPTAIAMLLVTRPAILPVIEQTVPSATLVVAAAIETSITVPGVADAALRVRVNAFA